MRSYKERARRLKNHANQIRALLKEYGRNPVKMTDDELLKCRGVGPETLKMIRKLTGPGKPKNPGLEFLELSNRAQRAIVNNSPSFAYYKDERRGKIFARKLIKSGVIWALRNCGQVTKEEIARYAGIDLGPKRNLNRENALKALLEMRGYKVTMPTSKK